MKCKELLPDEAIEDLVHKIESYKAKLLSDLPKGKDASAEKSFLNGCLKLFEKRIPCQVV